MRNSINIIQLCVVLLVTACGGATAQRDPADVQGEDVPRAVTPELLSCGLIITRVVNPGMPLTYTILVKRVNCIVPPESVVLGNSISHDPVLSLVSSELGAVATYTQKQNVSGSSPVTLGVVHVDPETLAIVRSTNLAVYLGRGSISSGTPRIEADGTTLTVSGTKSGVLLGEVGSGSHYVATYPDFFTSTLAPTIVAY